MSQTKSNSRISLEQKIAKARLKLQEAYDTCGCTDSKVLATNIKLDRLLNRYQQKLLENTDPGKK
ncbi:MAG TPA: hypothetical protein DDW50_17330 [Firmicutes bacterium]|jgi:hypothetical protein|nr:hypothetical protein [Bacillota bacterium]